MPNLSSPQSARRGDRALQGFCHGLLNALKNPVHELEQGLADLGVFFFGPVFLFDLAVESVRAVFDSDEFMFDAGVGDGTVLVRVQPAPAS